MTGRAITRARGDAAHVPSRGVDWQGTLALVSTWKAALAQRVAAGELAATTQETYSRGLGRFLAWMESDGTAWMAEEGKKLVDDDTVREWIGALRQRYKPASVNTWLAGLRAFFRWAVGKHLLSCNPTTDIKGARRTGTKKRHSRKALTDTEVLLVLDRPDQTTTPGARDYAILCLMAFTAVRSVEVHRADREDLTTEANRLVLYVLGKGQDEKEPVVIAHPRAEEAMYAWLAQRGNRPGALFTSLSDRSRGKRLSLQAIRALVKRYYAAAGVDEDGKSTHSLRHAAISSAIRHGAPIQKVQSMAHHVSIDTTMIYYHENDRIENPAEQYVDYGNGK